ncbi:hypothetical protein M407DRAFT_27602 [Tulasnella calospora MUT 4182]|uniref:Uncharacterized protein n=1 Tax=Tulasnella calospora MUT 4182 TaxID=1051891 RepID=A0A0C3Q2V2_9AGAM|nr:hypothetical protein M407DRAFT_27602 [Tulasnella calospora MUT 4182]
MVAWVILGAQLPHGSTSLIQPILGSPSSGVHPRTYSESDAFLACKPLGLTAAEFAAAPKWTLFLLTDGTLPTATDETLEKVDVQSCIKTKLVGERPWSLNDATLTDV